MREMTITKALSEIKLLEARIKKELMNTSFISYKMHKQDKLFNYPILVSDYEKDVKAKYQSIRDLISERNKIKQAVILSNANTKLMIAGKEYTVAEAIERKQSIELEVSLLNTMTNSYNKVIQACANHNSRLEDDIQNLIETLVASDNKSKDLQANAEALGNSKRESETMELVDPIGVKTIADALDTEIAEFKAEVDMALSVSNATTVINI